MTSWLDQLPTASFRGEPFEISAGDAEIGRQVVTHRMPRPDGTGDATPNWSHEDLGPAAPRYTIEAELLGDDLLDRMRRFEAALIAPGPGQLIHPWYGTLDVVVVGPVRARVSTKAGRLALYTFTVEPVGLTSPAPTAQLSTARLVEAEADAAEDAVLAEFAADWSLDGAADFVVDDAVSALSAIDTVVTVTASLAASLARGDLGALASLAPAEIRDAVRLGLLIFNVFRGISRSAGVRVPDLGTTAALRSPTAIPQVAPGAGVVAIDVLATLGQRSAYPPLWPAPVDTPSRRLQQSVRRNIDLIVRAAAVIEAARVGSATRFESRDQAIAARDRIAVSLDQLGDELGAAGWDGAWRGVSRLRAAAIRDVNDRAAHLPSLRRVSLPATLPACVVAHRLDGDDLGGLFGRAEDLAARNRLRHPGFVPGAQELEVLL